MGKKIRKHIIARRLRDGTTRWECVSFRRQINSSYPCASTTLQLLDENPVQPYVVKIVEKMISRNHATHRSSVLRMHTQRESMTKDSDVKIKSDSFAQITAIDTEAKSKIKNLERRKVVSWSHVMEGCRKLCGTSWMIINLKIISKLWVNWPMHVPNLHQIANTSRANRQTRHIRD